MPSICRASIAYKNVKTHKSVQNADKRQKRQKAPTTQNFKKKSAGNNAVPSKPLFQ
jgi:hypothetical protein